MKRLPRVTAEQLASLTPGEQEQYRRFCNDMLNMRLMIAGSRAAHASKCRRRVIGAIEAQEDGDPC
jgi:hypothetical protein